MTGWVFKVIFRLFEKSTIGIIGLFASLAGLLLSQIENIGIYLSIGVVLLSILLLLGRRYGPRIRLKRWVRITESGTSHLSNDTIRVGNEVASIDMLFTVPSYIDEFYVVFDIDLFDVSISQQTRPSHFDGVKAIICHDNISRFKLKLNIQITDHNTSNITVPLRIVNKLNGRTIDTLSVEYSP